VFAGYNTRIAHLLGAPLESTQGLAIGKLYDALLVVTTILVLTILSGADLGSLFLKKGNLRLGLGIGALVLLNFLTSALIFYAPAYSSVAVLARSILWGTLFSFSNALLEELWFRGLFLRHLVPLIGVVGTVLLTSLWFSLLHALALSYLPSSLIPIFLVNTFTLGLACGILILKTTSIWGAVMIHAAADLFLFIAVLATHQELAPTLQTETTFLDFSSEPASSPPNTSMEPTWPAECRGFSAILVPFPVNEFRDTKVPSR
jgi:membrane protease YdiL (CAAX protease family)